MYMHGHASLSLASISSVSECAYVHMGGMVIGVMVMFAHTRLQSISLGCTCVRRRKFDWVAAHKLAQTPSLSLSLSMLLRASAVRSGTRDSVRGGGGGGGKFIQS